MNPTTAAVVRDPIEVRAYACAFKCGRNVLTSRAGMFRHQALCYKNPATRSCATCKHWEKIAPGDDDPGESWCAKLNKDLAPKLFSGCESWEARADALERGGE